MEILHFAKSRRGGELIGIVILAAGLSLGAALITYHPDDSSAFYTSTNNAISNAIGYYGATVAWIFVGFFGFASLLFPLGMLVIGWQRFWDQEVAYVQTKAFGWVTLLIAVPPLLDLTFGKVWLRGALIASGGTLLYGDDNFQQSDYGNTPAWNGSSTWTLASFAAAGYSAPVNPAELVNFVLANNGQQSAADTGLYWYFAGVQIRTDGWVGP